MAGDQDASKVFELAQGLAGLTRQWGVHACAVLMCSEPLMDIIPIMKRPSDGATITQFEYPLCEELGVLKMDFLGLSNLTTIEDALDNIVYNGKERVAIEEVELDDQPTFELLQRADTLGVFQLDGSGMRALLKQMRPTEFEDISAVSALYRPGPMGMNSHTSYALRKNGLQEIAPIHPELEEPLREILAPTYGLIVYQEQVMQIARVCAGFTMGQADTLRKAMGKRSSMCCKSSSRDFPPECSPTDTRKNASTDCGRSSFPSPSTLSTNRTRPVTASFRIGRPSSRPTTRSSSWPRF